MSRSMNVLDVKGLSHAAQCTISFCNKHGEFVCFREKIVNADNELTSSVVS